METKNLNQNNEMLNKGEQESYYNDYSERISVDFENNILLLSKGGSNFQICNRIVLNQVGINQQNRLVSIALGYYINKDQIFNLPLIDIKYFKPKYICEIFSAYGICIRSKFAKNISNYIEYLYNNYSLFEECSVVNTYDSIGFLESQPGTVDLSKFYTKFVISKDSIVEGNLSGDFNNLVTYAGNKDEINRFLQENIDTEETILGLSLGLLGPVSSILGDRANVGNALVNISGRSSTGKSTIANLGVSLFSKPIKTDQGLYRNANGTTLSIERSLNSAVGMTFYVDDFSAFASRNPRETEKFIYSMESEYGRTSCNFRGGVIQPPHRKGAIIFTSEKKLADNRFKAGALVRVLELADIAWTKSAEHAEIINNFCKRNYGILGPELVKTMLNYGYDELEARFDMYRESLLEEMESLGCVDEFTPRISVLYSLIMVCVDVVSTYYKTAGIELENDTLQEYMTDLIALLLLKQEVDYYGFRNSYEDDYNKIVEFYKLNTKKFINNLSGIETEKNNFFGRHIKCRKHPNKLAIVLNYVGIENLCDQYDVDLHCYNVEFLQYLEENDLIAVINEDETTPSKRYFSNQPINGTSFKAITIFLPEELKDNDIDL